MYFWLTDFDCKKTVFIQWRTTVYSCFYWCLLYFWRLEPRKLQPHLVEVNAIQLNSTQILHKVHFPNDTDEVWTHTPGACVNDRWQPTLELVNLPFFSRPCRYLRWRQRPESRTSSRTLPRSWVWPQRKATAFLSKHIIRFAWIFFSRSIFAMRVISIIMNTPTCMTVVSLRFLVWLKQTTSLITWDK